jgi:pyruvate-formate lyase-activating enzyme|tara:strand:+ start:4933 stop:6078 length:1146 start_codon:yes stop_codon:yes gene_type:complete
MENKIDLEQMYRLPWTNEDNPNGWIEVTTFCQLKCPGCYRGLAEEDPERLHEDLEKMKSEIDFLIENRNIQTLSIAGGEPLLYPKLKEIVEYAVSKKLKVKIFTNGVLLTENKLIEFKDIGVTEFVVHVDKYQNRPDMKNDDDPNKLRLKFCEKFRKVGGINLGFILPVSGDDYSDLLDAINLCKKNTDVVNLLVLSPYKDILLNEDKTFDKSKLKNPNIPKLSSFLSKEFKSKPCAFLGKIHSKDQPSWIFMVPVFYKDKVVGYLDSFLYRKFQERYKKKKGKYTILIKGNNINAKSLLPFAFKKNVSELLLNYRKARKEDPGNEESLKYQVILIIDGPDKVDGKWNLCDGCPDAMLHNGKLVPSCLLERVKAGEEILVK